MTYTCDNGGHKTAPSAEDGTAADDELDQVGDKGDDVGDEHPLGGKSIDVDSVTKGLRYGIGVGGILQAPDVYRVEVILRARLAALVDLGDSVLDGAIAVVPQ